MNGYRAPWRGVKLTNLSPSCSTRQLRKAVWPTRVVMLRATEKSKYGCEATVGCCDAKFWFMLLLSWRLFVSKFRYAWYGSGRVTEKLRTRERKSWWDDGFKDQDGTRRDCQGFHKSAKAAGWKFTFFARQPAAVALKSIILTSDCA